MTGGGAGSSAAALMGSACPGCRVRHLWQTRQQPGGVQVGARSRRLPGSLCEAGLQGSKHGPLLQTRARRQRRQQGACSAGPLLRTTTSAGTPDLPPPLARPHLQGPGTATSRQMRYSSVSATCPQSTIPGAVMQEICFASSCAKIHGSKSALSAQAQAGGARGPAWSRFSELFLALLHLVVDPAACHLSLDLQVAYPSHPKAPASHACLALLRASGSRSSALRELAGPQNSHADADWDVWIRDDGWHGDAGGSRSSSGRIPGQHVGAQVCGPGRGSSERRLLARGRARSHPRHPCDLPAGPPAAAPCSGRSAPARRTWPGRTFLRLSAEDACTGINRFLEKPCMA